MAVWKIKERYELSRANDNRPNRAIEMAGFEPSHTKNGSSILMASSSNSTDFGDLTNNRTLFGGMTASNQTRALFYGGEVPGSNSNEIDSIQLATEGNASDHGDLTTAVGYAAATSNGTRALVAGGNTVINVIGFGSIAQTGNFADFGDLAESRNALVGICSPTRAIFAGGTDGTSPSPAYSTRIDFVTINSTGNASDFGDLTGKSGYMSTCQDKTKAFFICLGDMPLVKQNIYNLLIQSKDSGEIIVPTFRGQQGNPVLFSISMKNKIKTIKGDSGAKKIIAMNKNKTSICEIKDESITIDYNTKDSFNS